MKQLLIYAISIYFIISFFGCQSNADKSKEIIEINLTKEYDHEPRKLSDFAKEIKLIKLETNEQSMIKYFRGYIGDKNIISIDYEKILQFSSEGKFLHVIARKGRGPDEFGQIDAWDIDKNENFLFFHDHGKNYIKKYNLNSSKFEEDIPFADNGYIDGMLFLNDTLLSILPNMFSNYGYLYFYQSTSGRIITGKKMEPIPNPGLWVGESPVFKKATDNSILFQPSESDTIFNINKSEIKPIITLLAEIPQKNEEVTTGSNVSLLYLDNKSILLQKNNFETRKTSNSVSTKSIGFEYLLLDKNTNKLCSINPLYHDYDGIILKIPMITFLNNNQFVIFYQALDFKRLIEDAIKNGDISESRIEELEQFYKGISEFDNPILLTGKWL